MTYRREFTIGLRETQDFYLSLTLNSWWKGILGFGVVGALVAWMYLSWLSAEVGPLGAAAIALLTALATIGAVLLGMTIATRYRVRSQMKRAGKERYVQTVEVDGFGVHVAADGKKAKLGFDKLVKVQETGKAFYLFLSANQAWLLPKAQMEDPAGESEQLRTIFRTVIESRRLKLKK